MSFSESQQNISRTLTAKNGSSPLNDEEVILKEAEHHFTEAAAPAIYQICIPVINEKRDDKPARKPVVITPPAKPGRRISKGRRLPKPFHREKDNTVGFDIRRKKSNVTA